MIGKDILDKVFGISFRKGHYKSQLAGLNAQGAIGATQKFDILIQLLEATENLEIEVNSLKERLNLYATSQKRDSNKTV